MWGLEARGRGLAELRWCLGQGAVHPSLTGPQFPSARAVVRAEEGVYLWC